MGVMLFPKIDIDDLPIWKGDLAPLECIAINEETHNVKSFTFKSKIDAWFKFLPGQHTTLFLKIDNVDIMRTYTIASSPTRPHTITITNKLLEDGTVTNWMHENLKVGDCIDALNIGGSFGIAFDQPRDKVLFVSGGSGITPMLSMLRYLIDLSIEVDIVYLHNAQTSSDLIAKDELEFYEQHQENFRRHFVCDNADQDWLGETGFLNLEMLKKLVPDFSEREIYCCGPKTYMDNVQNILNGVGFDMLHYHQESFDIESSTAQQNMAESSKFVDHNKVDSNEVIEYNITLDKSGERVSCGSNTSLLVAIQKAGVVAPFACSMGMCGTCRTKMIEGKVDMDAQGGLLKSHEEEGYILICCSYPESDLVIEL